MNYRILLIICFLSLPVSLQAKTLLVLGDSISAAYGIPVEKGWVSLLERRLIEQGYDYKVVNASITGETSFGASFRLHGLLKQHQPELVIIELGGNDGLQGHAIRDIEANFIEMVRLIKQEDSKALLVPMQMPPNYGAMYNERFASIYEKVSETLGAAVSEFIFQGFADDPKLMQADGVHPVQAAQLIMLDNIWPSLKELLIKN